MNATWTVPAAISSVSGLVLPVADLDRTAEFYQTLGFRLGQRDERRLTCYVNWFWVTFTTDQDSAAGEPDSTLYLKVDDIDDYYGAVLAHGLTPSSEPRKDRSGRREFVLCDPDDTVSTSRRRPTLPGRVTVPTRQSK